MIEKKNSKCNSISCLYSYDIFHIYLENIYLEKFILFVNRLCYVWILKEKNETQRIEKHEGFNKARLINK